MLKRPVIQEVLQVVRFSAVGLAAAAVHLSVALGMVSFDINPIVSNGAGFMCAFFLSFFGHHYWTFQQKIAKNSSMIKFFTVALTAFLVNNGLLIALINRGALSKQTSIVIAVLVIPIITYLASRAWAFK